MVRDSIGSNSLCSENENSLSFDVIVQISQNNNIG